MTINPKRIGLMAFDASIRACVHEPAVLRVASTSHPKVRIGRIAFPFCDARASTDNGRITCYGNWPAIITYKRPSIHRN